MTYGLIGRMIAHPGKRAELAAILVPAEGTMPGCLSYIVAEDPAWDALLEAVESDAEADRHDVRIETDGWVHGDRRRSSRFLSAPTQAAIAS